MRPGSRATGVVAVGTAVLLTLASPAAGAKSAADFSIFIAVGASPGPALPTIPNGDSATVTGPNFATGIRIRNAGPETASLRFRIELGAGLRWGNDAPDPTEDCTGTETVGECAPSAPYEQTPSLHPSGFAWDVVAAQAGSYTIRATIVSASTSDPDQSNDTATVTIVVRERASSTGGGRTVSASRVSLSPAKPKAGSAVRASVRVLVAGVPVRPTRVTCRGAVAGARVAGVPRATTGKATCIYRPGRAASGKTLRGSIAFRAGTTSMMRRFSVKLR